MLIDTHSHLFVEEFTEDLPFGDGTCAESGSFLYFYAQYRQYDH